MIEKSPWAERETWLRPVIITVLVVSPSIVIFGAVSILLLQASLILVECCISELDCCLCDDNTAIHISANCHRSITTGDNLHVTDFAFSNSETSSARFSSSARIFLICTRRPPGVFIFWSGYNIFTALEPQAWLRPWGVVFPTMLLHFQMRLHSVSCSLLRLSHPSNQIGRKE